MAELTVIVPTFNEAPNVAELVARIAAATTDCDATVLFVDDSTDGTPAVIRRVAAGAPIPVSLIHRDTAVGGLSGAVLDGLRSATSDWCVVMDGDLQHPPELIPELLARAKEAGAGVVVASRHIAGGSTAGLGTALRHAVSGSATVLTRAMFPIRLRNCSDPMTGYFALRRSAVDLDGLRPRGFKILLEILARTPVVVAEVPFVFGQRTAGESKSSLAQGLHFLVQLAALRFGRMSGFAAIGVLGAVANLLIMAGLQQLGVWYLTAAIEAAVVTIVGNFVLLELFVFHDLRDQGRGVWVRFGQSFGYNAVDTVARTALLFAIVETTVLPSVPVQAALIAVSFVLRFLFHARIVYRPKRTRSAGFDLAAEMVPDDASLPGVPEAR